MILVLIFVKISPHLTQMDEKQMCALTLKIFDMT